jgi:hypothetical protein
MSTTFSQYARLVRPNKLRVIAPRVPIDLHVESKTIGTSAAYHLYTEDVSRSGLLLVWDRDTTMPFNVNTLLEMIIDPSGTYLGKPLTCLGKVVRREIDKGEVGENQAATTRLGVQIVQIDKTDLNAWEGCLTQLEKQFGVELVGKIMGQ